MVKRAPARFLPRPVSLAFLAAFLFLALSVYAVPSVVLQPASGRPFAELYPGEVTDYEIRVENSSPQNVRNVYVEVRAAPGLSLVVNERERADVNAFFPLIAPGEAKVKPLRVKAISTGGHELVARYGFERFTHSASTLVNVVENPVEFNARLEKRDLSPGEKGRVFFDIANNGSEMLRDVSVSLRLPNGYVLDSGGFSLPQLTPGQSVKNAELSFKALDEARGVSNLAVVARYTDSRGLHSLEIAREVAVEREQRLLIFLVVAPLIVLAIFLIWRKGPQGRKTIEEKAKQNSEVKASEEKPSAPPQRTKLEPLQLEKKKLKPIEKPFQERR